MIRYQGIQWFRVSLILVIMAIFTSCMDDLKKDDVIPSVPMPEGVKIGSVELGPTYLNQVFYSLETNRVIKTYTIYEFDLAFESSEDGWHILLNSSRFMHAANSGSKEFSTVTTQSGLEMKFDNSNGSLDSTAIGNWAIFNGIDTISAGWVYVIDMGLDNNGNSMGYKKLEIESLINGIYTIRFANLDGSGENSFAVPKNPVFSFVGFSFENGGAIKDFEPVKSDFDLFIGQYTTLLYSGTDPYPYLVRGVLLNRVLTSAFYYEGEKSFEEIEFDDISGLEFSSDQDVIGHEWKYYNLEEGFYRVETDQVYIIRNQKGTFFKLHFIGFYNNEGEVGYPKFEFMKLN